MPGPEPAPGGAAPTEASLRARIDAAGLTLSPAQLPGVLETARFLHRANALVAAYLHGSDDASR